MFARGILRVWLRPWNCIAICHRNLKVHVRLCSPEFSFCSRRYSFRVRPVCPSQVQLDNLTANKRIAPLGYPSLPFTFRLGLRFTVGHSSSR